MTTVIDGTTGSDIAGNATVDGNLTVGGNLVVAGTSTGSTPIQPISASVAGNALTLTLSVTSLAFRSTDLTSGTVTNLAVLSPISLTVPTSATLGTTNAIAARLVLVALNNAGTVELGVVNLSGGTNLDETTLLTTTAISASATSASVVYSTSARTNVAFRVVGFVDITQATAGTWATGPTKVQGVGGEAFTSLSSIGYGQIWQDVTASRALATTYYNTTGRPIQIFVQVTATGGIGSGPTVTINGLTMSNFSATVGGSAVVTGCYYVVPAMASYSVQGGATLTKWFELR